MAARRQAYWKRRTLRHLGLALSSGVLTVATFYAMQDEDTVFRLSMASAYVGLLLLGTSLAIGPLNVLRDRPNPVSTDLRRDVGIWAGLLGLAHVAIGLFVHLRGRPWLYFIYSPGERLFLSFLPLRHDLFGLANYAGLAVMFVLVLLLVLSNDLSLRKLGAERWKTLQRWNYAGFALMAAHGIAYQLIEKRQALFVMLFGMLLLAVLILQLSGFRKRCARTYM